MENNRQNDNNRRSVNVRINKETVTIANLINKYRNMKENRNGTKSFLDLQMNENEKEVLKRILSRLKIRNDKEMQNFFSLQDGKFERGVIESEIRRINTTDGDSLRLSKKTIHESLTWNREKKAYDFTKMEAITTKATRRFLSNEELDFFQDASNKCIVIRDIFNFNDDIAKLWLNHESVIAKTKIVGEKIIKGVCGKKVIFDDHKVQAKIEDMNNPYMEGLSVEMGLIVEDMLNKEVILDVISLIRERGAENQCMHTDELGEMSKVSVFVPTYNKYRLAVYKYRGLNECNQEVMDQYILEANVGDMIIFRSDFPHNGIECNSDGTIIFAYGNDPNAKKTRIPEGGKVNRIENRRMRNKRYKYKICVKGYLRDNTIRDADENHRLKNEEADLLSLDILMSNLQLSKPDSEYITFMQNIMFYTLLMTVNKKLVVEVFIQLGVATGEMDVEQMNGSMRELFNESMQRKLSYSNEICKEIGKIKIDEWIEFLINLDRPWLRKINHNEEMESEIKRYLRCVNITVDIDRIVEKITNIAQKNQTVGYELTIINLRTLEVRYEDVQMNDISDEIPICNDSNENEKDTNDISEENSLLSEHILKENDSWLENTVVDDSDKDEVAEDENKTDMIVDEEEIDNKEGGARDRFKAMIMDGLGKEHWDREERVCIIADTENLEYFAEKTVEDIIINDDLKFNLQKAINKSGLLFHIRLEKKTSLLTDPINLPIEKLIFSMRKEKKTRRTEHVQLVKKREARISRLDYCKIQIK